MGVEIVVDRESERRDDIPNLPCFVKIRVDVARPAVRQHNVASQCGSDREVSGRLLDPAWKPDVQKIGDLFFQRISGGEPRLATGTCTNDKYGSGLKHFLLRPPKNLPRLW